jgi:hypothetical protein
MKKSEFMKACDKAGCTLRDGKVMFGDMEFGTYTELGFDVTASIVNTNLRHCWMYSQVDLNTFKVLLKNTIDSLFSSIGGPTNVEKD